MFDPETEKEILKILKQGNTVELKRENGKLVVVEIRRKAISKRPL